MNAFCEHHKNSIRFHYACFDRILLNGVIQMLLPPERALGFFSHHRNIYPVTRKILHDLSEQYHHWVESQARRWDVPILTNPEGRREDLMASYFRKARPDQIVGIIKAREPASILISIGREAFPRVLAILSGCGASRCQQKAE